MVCVSVIIPVYNGERFIEDAVNSVLQQGFENFELIVVDDASTDKTLKIISDLKEKDERIKIIILDKNVGRAGALNRGLDEARGKYICFLDADDIFVKDRIKKQVEFLEENDIDMAYGDMKIIENGDEKIVESIEFDENPKEILLEASRRKDLGEIWPYKLLDCNDKERFIPSCSVMSKKKVFAQCRFDETLRNSEDYDLWFQIIGYGFKIKKMNLVTYFYRKHGGQKSGNLDKMKIAARYINEKLKQGRYFN